MLPLLSTLSTVGEYHRLTRANGAAVALSIGGWVAYHR
ncbi:hypothetical protein L837_0999 [Mycobacterium avium MAV_061107_1842]|nr:hypothetical protein L837_0999 [Mycobacterium avium MAV_061107_1842]